MSERFDVGVFASLPGGFSQEMVEALAACRPNHLHWNIHLCAADASRLPRHITAWRGDGALCTVTSPDMQRATETLSMPAVDVVGVHPGSKLPTVRRDETKIAQMSARYLLDLGYRRFAYAFHPEEQPAARRPDVFTRAVVQAGCEPPTWISGAQSADDLAADLQALPRPAAVWACSDYLGHEVIKACDRGGIHVPEDLAVLSVGNIDWICGLADPALSSIDINVRSCAWNAAMLLERMMRGEAAPSRPIEIEPIRVISRASTDAIAIEDPDVASALRFIREHVEDGIEVNDVADHVMISRRTLERRFTDHLRRSPSEEIWRIRIDRARSLLLETDLSMLDVAIRSGFSSAAAFSMIFKRHQASTPSNYRRRHRFPTDASAAQS